MFCKVSKTSIKGKEYYYASLVKSFRKDDKIKHKVVNNIGSVDYETALRLKIAFSKKIPLANLKGLLDSYGISHDWVFKC